GSLSVGAHACGGCDALQPGTLRGWCVRLCTLSQPRRARARAHARTHARMLACAGMYVQVHGVVCFAETGEWVFTATRMRDLTHAVDAEAMWIGEVVHMWRAWPPALAYRM
ncbi:MAG: hypothetical protein ACK4ZJ_17205, partial [Allorhizobium sp.]